MTAFSTDEGSGAYEGGLIVLPDGRQHGIEAVVRLSVRSDTPALPDLLGTLRGALPAGSGLAMPLRLALSTVRAGLGAIEESLGPSGGHVAVEIVFADGRTVLARMPPDLAATMDRDRDLVLAALARATPAALPTPEPPGAAEPEGTAEALTSIFRYEKRNGRLRRIVEPDGKD